MAAAPDDVVDLALRSLTRRTRHTGIDPTPLRREHAEVRWRRCARTSEGCRRVPPRWPSRYRLSGAPDQVVMPPHRRDLNRPVPVIEVAARGIGRELPRTRHFH